MLDENPTLEMIHFVLYAHRQQSLCVKREGLPGPVQCADLDALGTPYFFINARHRQTAFLAIRFTAGGKDLRVN